MSDKLRLEVNDVSFDYPEKSLLHHVSFNVESGMLLHLRGKNGTGKTTLLKILAGLIRPSGGEVRFNHLPITTDLSQYHQNLCYIGHKLGIHQSLTVYENCQWGLKPTPGKALIEQAMLHFGLESIQQMVCGLLSVGQKRRVSLARLLLSNTSIWLLDEPLNGLDSQTIEYLLTCLINHLETGGMVVLTSHQAFQFPRHLYQEYDL